MADADFTPDGVILSLTKEEWWSYALHGNRLADHDFRSILMIDSEDAERLHEELTEAEQNARASGNHWSPRPDW